MDKTEAWANNVNLKKNTIETSKSGDKVIACEIKGQV